MPMTRTRRNESTVGFLWTAGIEASGLAERAREIATELYHLTRQLAAEADYLEAIGTTRNRQGQCRPTTNNAFCGGKRFWECRKSVRWADGALLAAALLVMQTATAVAADTANPPDKATTTAWEKPPRNEADTSDKKSKASDTSPQQGDKSKDNNPATGGKSEHKEGP